MHILFLLATNKKKRNKIIKEYSDTYNVLKINENATLLFSISLEHGLFKFCIYQTIVFNIFYQKIFFFWLIVNLNYLETLVLKQVIWIPDYVHHEWFEFVYRVL